VSQRVSLRVSVRASVGVRARIRARVRDQRLGLGIKPNVTKNERAKIKGGVVVIE
jgi:hypothetical protein